MPKSRLLGIFSKTWTAVPAPGPFMCTTRGATWDLFIYFLVCLHQEPLTHLRNVPQLHHSDPGPPSARSSVRLLFSHSSTTSSLLTLINLVGRVCRELDGYKKYKVSLLKNVSCWKHNNNDEILATFDVVAHVTSITSSQLKAV